MAERHVKVDPSTYTQEKYTSNRGFYYDSQLEDPFLSISLHPNTYKNEKGEWKEYESDINPSFFTDLYNNNIGTKISENTFKITEDEIFLTEFVISAVSKCWLPVKAVPLE